MKTYIAGPMTGMPNCNFEAFFEAAEKLRALGHEPVNPADNDGPTLEEASANQHSLGDWHAYMRRDIPRLLDCDAIFLLDGWQNSRGASLEAAIADGLGLRAYSAFDPPPSNITKPYVLGLTGYAQSGKDTFASFLVESHGFERIAFADKLKAFTKSIDGHARTVVNAFGWEEAKKNVYVRRALQDIGIAARTHIDPDVWVNAALRDLEPGKRYVVTDVRFPNEVQAVWGRGGEVYRVNRPGVGPVNDHVSETALDHLELPIIYNHGSLDDLRSAASLWSAATLD